MSIRHTGKICFWNGPRGWGKIQPDDPQAPSQVFLHISAFEAADMPVPKEGDRLSFIMVPGREPGSVKAIQLARAA